MQKARFGRTDAAFQGFTFNLATRVSQDPGAYLVDPPVAASYLRSQQDFATLLVKATDPLTMGPSATFAKNQSRKLLRAETQRLANQIENTMAVSDQLKKDLGLTVRSGHGTPVQRPTTAPVVSVVKQSGLMLKVRLGDEADPTRRGRPEDVAFASVMTFVGDHPPADPAEWVFQGNSSRNVLSIAFPPETPAGSTVLGLRHVEQRQDAERTRLLAPAGSHCRRRRHGRGEHRDQDRGHEDRGVRSFCHSSLVIGHWSLVICAGPGAVASAPAQTASDK